MRFIRRASQTAGLAPGTAVHVGPRRAEKVRIRVMTYNAEGAEERDVEKVEECFPLLDESRVTWINVDGLHQVEVIEALGKHFGVHPLVIEDIANTGQRPKTEDYDNHLYVVLKMLYTTEEQDGIEAEQVSLILGENFVISFQEREGDVFEPVRERIRAGKGRIRTMGTDYLVYSLMDAIVDGYFLICETFGERVEELEDEVVVDPDTGTSRDIHALKREIIQLRKSIWPLREVISGLQRVESKLIGESTQIYLRDVYDHTIQVIDTIESFRDMVSGLLDIYLSSLSNRMNEVMKVLTIIATLFIPLTFIAGVYGMNFQYMPELDWRWGYPAVLGVMLAMTVGMLFYFRKKDWL
ncbi:MAG: magnesium/cobalt transporter CorA [Planctomycetota bacterium]